MKCAIYCRLSREDNKADESESIQNQRLLLREYAAARGWEIACEYADDDMSGADPGRPGFNRMIDDAGHGMFSVILCKTQSRFTRDLEQSERYLHGLFDEWGIRFVTAVDNIDTGRRDNLKARQLNGLINEWYIADLSENVRAVFDVKRRRGDFIGSFAPYGYKKSPLNHSRLIPDDEAAAVVRDIFDMAGGGISCAEIARRLNSRGIPNPSEYKRLHGENYRNGGRTSALWSRSTVSRILRSECYFGAVVQGKREKLSYKSKKLRERPRSEWIVVYGLTEPLVEKQC